MTDRQAGMLDELLEVEGGLSGWEMDFTESLDTARGRSLAERQADKLAHIGRKCFD